MEGLLLAEALRPLLKRLPAERGAWRFPDDRTAVLPLAPHGNERPLALWISSRPPEPSLALLARIPDRGEARTPFQEQLAARVTGPLDGVAQQGLDRVVEFRFAETRGFVPQPSVTLVAELTGRNANLVLVDGARRIVGVERQVSQERNRYRELKPGLVYRPPPPYEKLDPRVAAPEVLRASLRGRRLADVKDRVDGLGPRLSAALAEGCGVAAATRLDGADLERVIDALSELATRPSAWLERFGGLVGLEERRRRERRERALAVVREAARRRVVLAERRLEDARRASARAEDAVRTREEADLLMAYATMVPDGAERTELPGFDGRKRSVALDPRLDAFANARKRYRRARRIEERARRAGSQHAALEAELHAATEELGGLGALGDGELERRAGDLVARRRRERRRRAPGVRFHAPHGFEVAVGRNARENDAVTFRLARSRDLWLHVQGSTGAHVVVLSGGREVPFDTVLFAARLAAGFSPARQSDNVPVDYTLRKNVWKVKGQPPGSVHFSQQKTVFVTPTRDADGAARSEPDGGAQEGER